MVDNADVVILGAGVMGASAAWHLARLGARVTLLEREAEVGRGSTGRATGGYRAQYATRINVRLSLLAREKLLGFKDEVGGEAEFVQAGYLWLARDAARLALLREAQAMQHEEGLREARMVTSSDIAAINPSVQLEGIQGGAYCPSDGFIRPLGILRGYLDAAQQLGAKSVTSVHLTGFDKDASGRLTAARTSAGRFAAGAFVDAAGPWAAEVARLAGVALPVVPLRRQVACTVPCEALPAQMPLTIWVDDGFHLRVRDGRVLLLLPSAGDPQDPWNTAVEPEWLLRIRALADARVPALRGVPLDPAACWAGLYEMSPDRHALLGPAPECENLYLINGSSGHGVMHAPALGLLLAEQILYGEARTLDVTALRPSRFAEGAPNPVSELL